MTEDINNYIFDFEKEVLALRQIVGARADEILFIDVGTDANNADRHKRAFVRQMIGEEKFEHKNSICFKIAEYAKDSHKSSVSLRDMVFLNGNEFDGLGGKFKELSRLYALYHEAAHALIPGKVSIDKDHPHGECVADAYAALMLLQRFGQETVPFLQVLSWLRANDALTYGDTSHLTSTVLDKIIFDSPHEDFANLAAEQTFEKAQDYADQWTPEVFALQKARPIFDRLQGNFNLKHILQDKLFGATNPVDRLLGSTNLSGYALNNLAFYVAAREAMPVLYPEMRVDDTYKPHSREISRATRLAEHAALMDFSAVFNNKSAIDSPTVADMITPRTANTSGPRP